MKIPSKFIKWFLQKFGASYRVQSIRYILPKPESIEEVWTIIRASHPTKDDLLQCLKEFTYAQHIRQMAGQMLIRDYLSELTIRNLDDIIIYSSDEDSQIRAAERILDVARSKDQLGQVVISASLPMSLRERAARCTLDDNPESHDLCRILSIPLYAEEALERLLVHPEVEASTLRHLAIYSRDQYRKADGSVLPVAARIKKHLDRIGRRIDFPLALSWVKDFTNWDVRPENQNAKPV